MVEVHRRIQRRTNMLTVLKGSLNGAQTVSELSKLSGVTRPAAESIIADLISLGWLQETHAPSGESTLGRPAARYKIADAVGYVLAIDFGAHHIGVVLATISGEILAEETVPMDENAEARQRLDAAFGVIEKIRTQHAGEILICSVATPGVVCDGKVIYFGGRGMPGWKDLDIAYELGSVLQTRVVVSGDCALGALGESWRGAAAGYRDVIYILAGIRTGAASVIDGRVRGGLQGSAGLVGELPQLRWRELENETFASNVYGEQQPPRLEIFESARGEDTQAVQAIEEYAHVLSLGIAAMVLTLAPECVVVGGRFSKHADLFIDLVQKNLNDVVPFPPKVVASNLDGTEIILGALRFGLDEISDSINHFALETDYFPSPNRESLWGVMK
ncbi:putative NBD/HSP70 family sugar kinase [Arcanobacterium pluranimalium]|uniref:ROK family protein n=1 Tax=Arcanobacterium pluranimalium TaxID=108028 RepID=UPI001958497F|nr:ROK family protein [Arcanobacterium pluranimalium]MBM7825171.1 putative NBD/HSP70 family sugar kinase [Arcanobacterium pluranimalium]